MNLETEINRDLWDAVRRSYDSQSWSNAILDSIYFLSDTIRKKSGLQTDGTNLAGQAFGGKSPKLKVNRMQTESEINIQAGTEQMVRGIYQAIRNPRSHEKTEDSQKDAEAIIVFVNYLLGVIGHAKAVFSIDDIISKILDENFVPNKRYAEILLEEIPKGKRLDTLLIAFEGRDRSNASRVKEFFQVGLASLEDEERNQFFDAISDDLRTSVDDKELISCVQLLEPVQWSKISEAARLRSENRFIKSIKSGRYSSANKKCLSGALGTWGRRFLSHFTLKEEVMNAILSLLESQELSSQDYAFEFFFYRLSELHDEPTRKIIRLFNMRLDAGDVRYYKAISDLVEWSDARWYKPFESSLKNFQEKSDVAPKDFEDDDIPF